MLEDKLAINLITYNRAAALDRTLTELRAGPFANCRITILDNCSTDETPAICAKHQSEFADLHIVRHPKNIGLSANYLRAVEISDALYTWILCDDDNYYWNECDDVIRELEAGDFDWIYVGVSAHDKWERGWKTSTRKLLKMSSRTYWLHTFVPNLIFKTNRFDSECMLRGYYNAGNMYPHIPFINRALELDFSEYVSRRPFVIRNTEDGAFSGLSWLEMVFNSATTIPQPHVRRHVLYGIQDGTRFQWLRSIAQAVVYAKLDTSPTKRHLTSRRYLQLLFAATGEQRQRLFLLAPLVWIPAPFYQALQKWWHKLKYGSGPEAANSPHSDQFRG